MFARRRRLFFVLLVVFHEVLDYVSQQLDITFSDESSNSIKPVSGLCIEVLLKFAALFINSLLFLV